ncbi:MAG: universal stress protein [Rubrivivax sp.]
MQAMTAPNYIEGQGMNVLIPVDGSPCSNAALAFMAARPFKDVHRPQIDLLNVQMPLPPRAGRAVGAEWARSWYEAESRKVLKPAALTLQQGGLDPAWYTRTGNPAVEISEWADRHPVDLIVMGSHGHTALKGLVLGSVTQKVLAYSAVPVLTLRTHKAPSRASLRVGIALDGGEYGTAASDYVLEHRPLWGPRPVVTLVHVRPPRQEASAPLHEGNLGLPVGTAEAARLEDAAFELVLAPVRQKFEQAQFPVQEQRIVGQPGHAIADFARSAGLDILVMGSHGRGSLTAAVLGSVAWRTAATCETPLLLIRKIA